MDSMPVDNRERIDRVTLLLTRLANDESPEKVSVSDDGAFGKLEQAANCLIDAVNERAQERLLFSIGPVVVFRWRNSEGWPVEYVSTNVTDLTGYSAAAFMTRSQIYSDLIPAEDLPRVFDEVQRYSAAGVSWFEHEPYRVKCADGKMIWVADYSVIRRDPSGSITHYFGYLFDITERIEQLDRLKKAELLIQKITTPVLRVWDGILAMPVLGFVDETRAMQMTRELLEEVSNNSIRVAVLDLTGLEQVDATTMEYLVRMVRAVKLLGCNCVISGISPPVARVIVGLGMETATLATFATLQSALAFALNWSDKRSRPK